MNAGGTPTAQQLKTELRRVRHRAEYGKMLRNTLYILIAVAAAAVLVATLCLPVLCVTGTSMEPTLENGQFILAVKNTGFQRGDIIAFYYNNKVLLKRVIGLSGDQIAILEDGSVAVNNKAIDEPYLSDKSRGECDITFPYQVPDGKVFVLGDHRATSVDSRSSALGCVSDEFIVGKVIFRIWPLGKLGGL